MTKNIQKVRFLYSSLSIKSVRVYTGRYWRVLFNGSKHKRRLKLNTEKLFDQAYFLCKPAIDLLLERYAKRKHYHIVIMDPRKKPWECSFEEAILAEFSQDVEKWEHDYKKIARSKAEQAWREQRANLLTNMLGPATLRPGDTIYWGSFEYYGVVAACSGVEPHFDMLISAWVVLSYQQLARHYLTKHMAAYSDEDFLP